MRSETKQKQIPAEMKDKHHKYLWRKAQDENVIKIAWKNLRKYKTKRNEVRKIEENFRGRSKEDAADDSGDFKGGS